MQVKCVSYAIVAACLVGGCSNTQSSRDPSACFGEVSGKEVFIGNAVCLATMPSKTMSGIWVFGNEYSVFYPGQLRNVPQSSGNDIWLEVDGPKVLSDFQIPWHGETAAYRVTFDGTQSDAPGFYGHFGLFHRGALVLKMRKIVPLKDAVVGKR